MIAKTTAIVMLIVAGLLVVIGGAVWSSAATYSEEIKQEYSRECLRISTSRMDALIRYIGSAHSEPPDDSPLESHPVLVAIAHRSMQNRGELLMGKILTFCAIPSLLIAAGFGAAAQRKTP